MRDAKASRRTHEKCPISQASAHSGLWVSAMESLLQKTKKQQETLIFFPHKQDYYNYYGRHTSHTIHVLLLLCNFMKLTGLKKILVGYSSSTMSFTMRKISSSLRSSKRYGLRVPYPISSEWWPGEELMTLRSSLITHTLWIRSISGFPPILDCNGFFLHIFETA